MSGTRHCRSDFNLVVHNLSVAHDALDNSQLDVRITPEQTTDE